MWEEVGKELKKAQEALDKAEELVREGDGQLETCGCGDESCFAVHHSPAANEVLTSVSKALDALTDLPDYMWD